MSVPSFATTVPTRGFVLGKFMPPHAGHLHLCRSARASVDRLTVLVCWLPGDPVPGPLRLEWMRALFPACRVLGHDAIVPQAPEDHPEFWPIWREIVRAAHPDPIDIVFASEPYGERLAAEVGARFRAVDITRTTVPVSGTQVRRDPHASWHHLPEPVRDWYARTLGMPSAAA